MLFSEIQLYLSDEQSVKLISTEISQWFKFLMIPDVMHNVWRKVDFFIFYKFKSNELKILIMRCEFWGYMIYSADCNCKIKRETFVPDLQLKKIRSVDL